MQIEKAYVLRIDDPVSRIYASDCVESCVKHGIRVQTIDGFEPKFTPETEFRRHTGLSVSPRAEGSYVEYLITAGHAKVWDKIARGIDACAVFEHDVVAKRGFTGLWVEDTDVLFLGYRVESRRDYDYPTGEPARVVEIPRHEGAHAYAVTPAGARRLLDWVHSRSLELPVDGFLGVQNLLGFRLMSADPPVAVAEVGSGRVSFARRSGKPSPNSYLPLPGFFRGLSAVEKYRVDGDMGWLKFGD